MQWATFTIHGNDRKKFLQGLITNNLEKIEEHQAIYTLILTPQGKYLYDFFIIALKDHYLLQCPSLFLEPLRQKLQRYILRAEVTIDPTQRFISAALSTDALSRFHLQAGQVLSFPEGLIFRDPRHPGLPLRALLLPEKIDLFAKHHSVSFLSEAAYTSLCLSLAIPEGGVGLVSEQIFPLHFGLEYLHAIDFNKGCYIGQEVTMRSKRRGSLRKLPIKIQGPSIALAPGTPITSLEGQRIGEIYAYQNGTGIGIVFWEEFNKASESHSTFLAENHSFTLEIPEWYPLEERVE